MGNKHSQHEYSFEREYDIIQSGSDNYGLYKLQNRQNRQLYVGRQLVSNDEHETYELECIVHEKLKNPSPFVTRLLNAQTNIQDSYCSTSNKFYLLFKEVPWLLADEIRERSAQGRPFSVQQIETVITRVSKGIRYLYDIYHHHGVISAKAISWPSNSREPSVQLIDEWVIRADGNEPKHKIFRPKDEEDISEKLLQKSNDLYSLGVVAKEMLAVRSVNNREKSYPAYDHLNTQIQVLLASVPQDRFKIYSMISKTRDTAVTDFSPPHSIPSQIQVLKIEPSPRTDFIPFGNTHYSSTIHRNISEQTNRMNLPTVNFHRPVQNNVISSQNSLKMREQASKSFNLNPRLTTANLQPIKDNNANFNTPRTDIFIAPTHRSTYKQEVEIRNSSVRKIGTQLPTNGKSNTEFGVPFLPRSNESLLQPIPAKVGGNIPSNKPTVNFQTHHQNSRTLHLEDKQFGSSYVFNNSLPPPPPLPPTKFVVHNPLINQNLETSFKNHQDSGFKPLESEQNLFTPADFFMKIGKTDVLQKEKEKIPSFLSSQFNSSFLNQNEPERFIKKSQPIQVQLKEPSYTNVVSYTPSSLYNEVFLGQATMNSNEINVHTTLRNNETSQAPPNGTKNQNLKNQEQRTQSNLEIHLIEPNTNRDSDFVGGTPAKTNNRSNQHFSTIPEVSQRSASARSDDEKQYVIEEYENGSRYEGYKSNGMRNGKGRFYYQEGSFYDGDWKNNNMHGYGRLYYSNNKLAYEGEWFIDQFHGRGKVFNDEPAPIVGFFDYTNFDNLDEKWKYYEGDLVCDSKQGSGKLVLSNEEYYQGQFRNDKVDGKGKFVTKNGEVVQGIWDESKLVRKL